MSDIPQITVYSLEYCPNCEILKEFLKSHGFWYKELDMALPENMTELRLNNVFVREAPVLQVGETFLKSADLFENGSVIEEKVLPLCKGE